MAEYITRSAAIAISDYAADEHPYEKMGSWENSSEYNEGWNDACDYIREKLENEPAADVRPVVRCKDCRWGQMDDLGIMHCHKYHMHKNVDGFCDEGERKEPENENTYSSI